MSRFMISIVAALAVLSPVGTLADIAAPMPPETTVSSEEMAPDTGYMAEPMPPQSQQLRAAPQRPQRPQQPDEPVRCTMDAKICPDGTGVGRIGPNCEFAPCPGEPGYGKRRYPPKPMPPETAPVPPPGGGGGAMPEPMPMPKPMPVPSIQIEENDRQCVYDSECVMVVTQCGGCDCGTPVNQMFAIKYKDRLMKACAGQQIPACNMPCPGTPPVCRMGTCQRQ